MKTKIKAALSAYIVLVGPFATISIGYVFIGIFRNVTDAHYVSLLFLGVAIGFAAWLNSFEIEYDDDEVIYRNGFYKRTRIPMDEIIDIKSCWMSFSRLSAVKVPRSMIITRTEKIVINPKPFSRKGFSAFYKKIKGPGTNRTCK